MQNKRVVVTGLGPMTSIGIGRKSLWDALIAGRTNVQLEECLVDGKLWEKFYLHRIDNFDINSFGINKEALAAIKKWKEGEEVTDLYYLLAAVKLAIDDSKLEYSSEDNNIGCVICHENAGLEQYFSKIIDISFEEISKNNNSLTKREFSKKFNISTAKSSYELQTFMFLFHIQKTFAIHGYSLFINNACSSGLYAIESARQIIQAGRCPVVIVASADYPRIYKYLWFKALKMYAEDGKIKPFSKNADGFVFGDAAVGLVLEDLEHAKKRKAKIYGEYLGGGFSQEGWKVTYPNPTNNFYQKAIEEALSFSKVSKEDIDLLCAHGAANPIVDRYEAKAITDVFGKKPKKPLITTFKPYVGHNLGGSALLETAMLLLCLENNIVLPVLNAPEVNPKLGIELVQEKIKKNLNIVIKICTAFAGYNAAALFRKYSQ